MPKTATPPPRTKSTRAIRRRELVQHYVRLYGTTSPTQIRELLITHENKKHARETIKDDINVIMSASQKWINDQARETWLNKINQMYVETNKEIIQIQDFISKLLHDSTDVPGPLIKIIQDQNQATQKEIISYLQGLHQKTHMVRYAGKIGYLNSILTEKRTFLIDMMTDHPLYQKTQELAEFFDSHPQK